MKMRIALLIALVPAAASASATKFSSLSDHIRQALWSRLESRQRDVFPNAPAAIVRGLQGASLYDVCLDEATVIFDDDYSQKVYGSAFQATCTCIQDDNTADVIAALANAPINGTEAEIEAFVDTFNTEFGNLNGSYDYDCASGCATCFDGGICGFMSNSEFTSFQGMPTNFTFEEIVSGLIDLDPADAIATADANSETCITYESGETGNVCWSLSYSGSDLSGGALPTCSISYNTVPCNSCETRLLDTNGTTVCYVADCTNFVEDAIIDSCAETGSVGPFRILKVLWNVSVANATLGTCPADNESGNETPPPGSTDAPINDTAAETLSPSTTVNDNTVATPFPTPAKAAVTDGAPVAAVPSNAVGPVAAPSAPAMTPSNSSGPVAAPARAPSQPTGSSSSAHSKRIGTVSSMGVILLVTLLTILLL
jgi:hypothetical protein